MEPLTSKKCVPCEGDLEPLTRAQFSHHLNQVRDWTVVESDTKLEREFEFGDFNQALAFVNGVGEIAESEGHHPNIYLHSWNKVKLTVYTHAIGGLSLNDFVLAAKIDAVG